MKTYILKLLLNLSTIALELALIYFSVKTFQHEISPIIGTISIVGLLIAIFIIITQVQNKYFRYKSPGMFKTTLFVILIAIIATFAGVQPLASYKDFIFDKISNASETSTTDITSSHTNLNTLTNTPNPSQSNPTTNPTITLEDKPSSIELEVVEIVNAIRKEQGSCTLQWNDTLYEYSLAHANDMASQRRLFHSTHVSYAENAWGGEGSKHWNAQTIVNDWLNSPMHRTWLLCPHLKHIAVGVAYSNNGMYAAWTFWIYETYESDWWYQYSPDTPPIWWYYEE